MSAFPTFHQQALADQAWFKANPDRSFRVRVVSNAELGAFLGSRDGFGPPIFPVGQAIMVSYWRFDSATTKAMDHLTIPSAPKWLVARADEDQAVHDELALDLVLRAKVHPGDIAFAGPAPIIITDAAA